MSDDVSSDLFETKVEINWGSDIIWLFSKSVKLDVTQTKPNFLNTELTGDNVVLYNLFLPGYVKL